MSQLLRLTDRSFGQEVLQSETPVLVEFSASWCVPSQQQKPLLEELASEYDGKVKICNLNVDQNPRMTSEWQILGCPTLIVFSSGKPVARTVGAQSRKQLEEMVNQAL